jgi:putative CocE/NonD family hydrolase
LTEEPPSSESADSYDYDPEDPVQTVGGNHSIQYQSLNAEVPIVAGPVDQRAIERRDDVLVYTGPPLTEDIEVTGPIDVVLYAASSALDTDFTVKLIDVYPRGQAMNLSEGILRARFRGSFEKPEPLERGEVQEFRIRLTATSNVFKREHRIRLDISSSNFPRFSRNLNTGEDVATGSRVEIARQTILHTSEYPSHVVLPVIPSGG